MDDDLLAAVADAIAAKTARDHPGVVRRPGRVTNVDAGVTGDQPWIFVDVAVAGDPPGVVTHAVATIADLAPGEWVVCTWAPPHAWTVTERLVNPQKGGAKPYATRVVAAVDSVAPNARNADFVCVGDDTDATVIQQAIADIYDSGEGPGGSVELLEGTFTVVADVITVPAPVWLRGQGDGTVLAGTGDGVLVRVDGGRLSDVRVRRDNNGNQHGVLVRSGGRAHNLWVDQAGDL